MALHRHAAGLGVAGRIKRKPLAVALAGWIRYHLPSFGAAAWRLDPEGIRQLLPMLAPVRSTCRQMAKSP